MIFFVEECPVWVTEGKWGSPSKFGDHTDGET